MLDRTAWSLRRTRPANHPIRRIAGIAAFLAGSLHTGLCRAMLRAIEEIPTGGGEARRCAETLRRFRAMFEEPQPATPLRAMNPSSGRNTGSAGPASGPRRFSGRPP